MNNLPHRFTFTLSFESAMIYTAVMIENMKCNVDFDGDYYMVSWIDAAGEIDTVLYPTISVEGLVERGGWIIKDTLS